MPENGADMTFWTNAFSTFVGAVSGILFSVIIFLFTSWIQNKVRRKTANKNLAKELQFNEEFMKQLLKQFDTVIQSITADDRNISVWLDYERSQRIFIDRYFYEGRHFDTLDADDLAFLHEFLNHMGFGTGFYNDPIEKWNTGAFDKQMMLKRFQFGRDKIEDFVKKLAKLRKKIYKS